MSNTLNAAVAGIPMPDRIKRLPVSDKGYPVPWFVPWDGNKPVTQAANPSKLKLAHRHRLCWTCGGPLGVHLAFILGPMCIVNRTSAEPASHRECAEYSIRACPFLSKPRMKRNPLPDAAAPAGIMIERNPGVCALWMTQRYTTHGADNLLFHVGDPDEVLFFREGRRATRAEILESFDTGLPLLEEIAAAEGNDAMEALRRMAAKALKLVPAQ